MLTICSKITHGNATSIIIVNESGNVIMFDIVVKTIWEALFACQFGHNVEVIQQAWILELEWALDKLMCPRVMVTKSQAGLQLTY